MAPTNITSQDILNLPWPTTVTELHCHLGGSVPIYRLWETAVERGIRGLGGGYEEFVDLLKISGDKIKDLDTYLEAYDKVELIQSGPQSIRQAIIMAVHHAYRTGGMVNLSPGGEGSAQHSLFTLGRLELRLNPLKRTGAVFHKGNYAGLYDVDRVIKSASDAVTEVQIAFKGRIQVGLTFCFGRDMTYEANKILAEKTAKWASEDHNIIAVDIAGPESVDPLSDPAKLERFKELFELLPARLGKTIHVGETPHVSLETFINTIEALNPHRVAHPIVAFRSFWEKKDDRGLKLLQERNLACEFCVKSNMLTRAVSDLSEYKHILDTCDDFSIPFTFSTDAPALQVTSLAEELTMLLHNGAATVDQVMRGLKTAEERSFLA